MPPGRRRRRSGTGVDVAGELREPDGDLDAALEAACQIALYLQLDVGELADLDARLRVEDDGFVLQAERAAAPEVPADTEGEVVDAQLEVAAFQLVREAVWKVEVVSPAQRIASGFFSMKSRTASRWGALPSSAAIDTKPSIRLSLIPTARTGCTAVPASGASAEWTSGIDAKRPPWMAYDSPDLRTLMTPAAMFPKRARTIPPARPRSSGTSPQSPAGRTWTRPGA